MNRFHRFIFSIGILAVIGGISPLRAEAALVELQLNDFQLSTPAVYSVNAHVRADYTGDVFTFASAAFPDSPASAIFLTPPAPNTLSEIFTDTDTVYTNDVCWPTGLFTTACGGIRTIVDYTIYHRNKTYALSLDGNIDTAAETATLTPTPETADLEVVVQIDSRVVLTGALVDAPDFIKVPLLAAANLAANQFGDGQVKMESAITAFEPTDITADVLETPSHLHLDVYWTDLMVHYAPPSYNLSGTFGLDATNTILSWLGDDNVFFRAVNGALTDEGIACPSPNSSNCIQFSEVNSASFSFARSNVPPGTAMVPEPATAALLGFGLAGAAFARRLGRRRSSPARSK